VYFLQTGKHKDSEVLSVFIRGMVVCVIYTSQETMMSVLAGKANLFLVQVSWISRGTTRPCKLVGEVSDKYFSFCR